MYKRIEELSAGKVNKEGTVLTMTPDPIRLEPVEGVLTSGSFLIESMHHLPVKGMVVSTDLRMEIKNPQFQGDRIEISYVFHGEHMVEGEVCSGSFSIISSAGEYDLSWSVAVKRLYAETSIGRIKNLDDFVKLYQTNWRESIHVFSASAFRGILRSTNERMLCRMLSRQPIERHSIEQFLLACQKKEPVLISLASHEAQHLHITEPIEEVVTLQKSCWGYARLSVSSDADFLVPEKEFIDSDDFNGDHMVFRYRIYPDRMHAGKNYAALTFSNALSQEILEITAVRQSVQDLEREDNKRKKQENFRLYRAYEKYVTEEMVLGEWARLTTDVLQARKANQTCTDLEMLWCAYAYICNRQLQEADWILEEYRHSRSAGVDREWAFYLYLCSLTENEQKVLVKLQEEIRCIYRKMHTDPWLRFVIMQSAAHNANVADKQLKLLEQWFLEGIHSPFLYAYAAEIYRKEPYLLLSLSSFELQVMNWICKHKGLTEDLARVFVRRAAGVHTYSRLLDRMLQDCYDAYPQEEMLAGVCAYRIKGERMDTQAHEWYALAIEHDLQITGLYEAFMASLDPKDMRQLPKTLQLYFQYSNHLSNQKKALLYVNIIAHLNEQPLIYERYLPIILDYAKAEILAGHMDDDLALIYAHVLDRLTFTSELARALSKILYVNQFTCPQDSYTHVIVQQENLKNEQLFPIADHRAYVTILPGNYVLLLQDAYGRRYALPKDAQMVRLLNPGKYIRRCLEYAPNELAYVLHHMNGKTKLLHMDAQMANYVRTLVRSDAVADAYKSRISPGFLEYCRDEGFAADMRDYLRKIDFGSLPRAAKDLYLESMIKLHRYEQAWTFMILYGAGDLHLSLLQEVVLAKLKEEKQPEEEHLIYFSMQCFLNGSRMHPILKYLCSYYQGPSNRMAKLWVEAYEQKLDCIELSERLLMQVMFTDSFTPDIQRVFIDYAAKGGRETIVRAYLTYVSYAAFVQQSELDEQIYRCLEQQVLADRRANIYMKLALLEYYTSLHVFTTAQENFVDEQIEQFLGQGLLFACFLKMPKKQLVRHHLYDKYVVEYRCASPETSVVLNYRLRGSEESFTQVSLSPVLDSICLWNISLLASDQLEYYICEKSERMETITESRLVDLSRQTDGLDNSFAKLSRMMNCVFDRQLSQLQELSKDYHTIETLTEKLFRLR